MKLTTKRKEYKIMNEVSGTLSEETFRTKESAESRLLSNRDKNLVIVEREVVFTNWKQI